MVPSKRIIERKATQRNAKQRNDSMHHAGTQQNVSLYSASIDVVKLGLGD